MHKEVLSENQVKLLPLVKSFSDKFGLVGGTAVALYLGHRRSIDFDLFTGMNVYNEKIRAKIKEKYSIQSTLVEEREELTLVAEGVKITFLKYPFQIKYSDQFEDIIRIPDLLTLSAMKVYSLGRRAKWKDYVDIFFILKLHSLEDIIRKTREIFGAEFNERLFREQLSYFDDIDYSEPIEYLKGKEVPDEDLKRSLQELSLR
ncbi:hypothetical protein A2982_01490 [candidate division WWE3 bacterium RIFCSPLOWO2_01_FULL_39_13]|uniref:Nucleotidyl transferase AbiEii/AbiGii toxin family protein n=1 Tax=candidate division WWE3 bacterium RIFCSPLOWO2_01_FULL_39_13 TaxID=1802624 RepID=A0A1F4V6B1_UNCKA|nr:MAG: hypothetical protein A2982_01490 [candidate division WWE3 bacterium RIFCSPLOWO2_01_FULL_39_13]